MKFTIWSLIWSQSSEFLKTKLKSLPNYDTKEMQKGCAWLLTQIRRVCQKVEHNMSPYVTVINVRKTLCNYKEKEDQNLLEYTEEVQPLGKTNDDMDSGIGLHYDCSVGTEIVKSCREKLSIEFNSADVTDMSSYTTWSKKNY